MNTVCSMREVRKRFGKSFWALKGLSLEICENELVCLAGGNGAGKTTALRILLGLLRPTSGDVVWTGYPRNEQPVVGFVPENVGLYSELSAIENVRYFASLAGVRSLSKELARSHLNQVGLAEEFRRKDTRVYSKGMRQKVALAAAIAVDARILVLDEPSSGLDPVSAAELMTLLRFLADEKRSIIVASHDLYRLRGISDRMIVLKEGEITAEWARAELAGADIDSLYRLAVGPTLKDEHGS